MRYQNPVHPDYFADPFVLRHGGRYFAIGTGPREAEGVRDPNARVFPMVWSDDLVRWHPAGSALVRPDPALGDTYWAPEIATRDGRFYLYYSVGHDDRLHQLRVAVSDSPLGPYEDVGEGLTSPDTCAFAIDPSPFRDHDGRWYLFHARDFLDCGAHPGGVRAGTALVVAELVDMTRLGPGRVVLRARSDWQRFLAQRAMYGGIWDWHTLEGPAVVRRDGRYYCFYSGGRWEDDTYGVDYGVADHVLGPWTDHGNEGGPRVLKTVPARVIGPGHCSLTTAPDGVTDVLVYHAWDPARRARRMAIDPVVWTEEGPRSPGPTWTEQVLGGGSPGTARSRAR